MITPEKCIPNCVGRLDPVVDAIKQRDWYVADDLLEQEMVRRMHELGRLDRELKKKELEYKSIKDFQRNIGADPGFRNQCVEEASR